MGVEIKISYDFKDATTEGFDRLVAFDKIQTFQGFPFDNLANSR
jgi:hypothetical protein